MTKRARKKKATPACVYCGKEPGTTNDHVPPKSLFPEPRPKMVKVPCCEACRKRQSKDDEYFKIMTVMRRDVVHEPFVQTVVDSVYRGLARPEGKGLANSLRRSARSIPKQTVSGSYVGVDAVYRIDTARLNAVMRRTLL